MNYYGQIKALVDHFKAGEKAESDFKIGMEMEHFIVNKDTLEAVPFLGEKGIESILEKLLAKKWQGEYEGNYLLRLYKKEASITLEPGAQLEISIMPCQKLAEIEKIYIDFLEDVLPILDKNNYLLLACAYQPQTKIKDISLLPKKRYTYMYNYLQKKGKLAADMMKGTASLQVNLDYKDEKDYRQKVQIAYYLSPIIYAIFDNGPFFAGKSWSKPSIRAKIWDNCDQSRCGLIPELWQEDYAYESYAKFLLNTAAIITKKNEKLIYTEDKLIKDIYDPNNFNLAETNHLLSMVFPDIRTKQFIEIRMGDSLPYPYNLAYVALWQGLLYDQNNLTYLASKVKSFNLYKYNKIKEDINQNGLQAKIEKQSVLDFFKSLVTLAKKGLNNKDKKYLQPLTKILIPPKLHTLNNLNKGKKEALSWCRLSRKDE